MMKTASRINLGKNRVLLSDVLPYELPVIYSNRHLLKFVEKYKIYVCDGKIKCSADVPRGLKVFKKLLLGNNKLNFTTIPFQFEIRHKINSCRKLTLVHPLNQLQIVEFYDKYKEFILYLCNRSSFSIRYPNSIAKYRYYRDRLHNSHLSDEELGIEQYEEEYENLKSFFVYEKYSNIHKFYDDFLFHRCEKKYDCLVKLDITRCFDSIYTHSISWAIYGKDYTKKNNFAKASFGDKFDKLMQELNYQETNGIIIGPEFSRIFAEIILQQIDKELLLTLKEKNIFEKKDYEIFRYVDDFFVFFNKETIKQTIISDLQHLLSEYKLYLNEEKEKVYTKPIISNISIAKNRITSLLDSALAYEIIDKQVDNKTIKTVKTHINSKHFIVSFKTIIKESGVEYKDILNYTFSIIENKLQKLFLDFSELCKDPDIEHILFKVLQHLLECVTFMYSCSPRVNTTIRFSRIIKSIITFLKRKEGNKIYKTAVFEQIYNDIMIIMKKNCPSDYTQIETSYLLIILQELGKDFDLSEEELALYFNIEHKDGLYTANYTLNYLSIVILLFYTRGKRKYTNLIKFITDIIKEKLIADTFNFNNCEDLLLFLDVLTCPYIVSDVKREILTRHNISDKIEQDEIITLQSNWFITWNGFNFKRELDAKKGQDVY